MCVCEYALVLNARSFCQVARLRALQNPEGSLTPSSFHTGEDWEEKLNQIWSGLAGSEPQGCRY